MINAGLCPSERVGAGLTAESPMQREVSPLGVPATITTATATSSVSTTYTAAVVVVAVTLVVAVLEVVVAVASCSAGAGGCGGSDAFAAELEMQSLPESFPYYEAQEPMNRLCLEA